MIQKELDGKAQAILEKYDFPVKEVSMIAARTLVIVETEEKIEIKFKRSFLTYLISDMHEASGIIKRSDK